MVSRFLLLALPAALACGKDAAHPPVATGSAEVGGSAPGAGAAAGPAPGACQPLPFAATTPVPEASAAAWITHGGVPALLVISDSGNRGAYGIVDPTSGDTLEVGQLPLGEAGQDIEGLASRGDLVHGVSSSGWIRVWRRAPGDAGFELAVAAYPLGPVDLPDARPREDRPPAGTGMVCGAKVTNCGRNYEGLCLVDRAHARGPCVGFVAAKADGHLYCVEERDGALVATYDHRIAIGRPGTLADCAFGDDGTLWAGANLFDASSVYRVDGWDTPATATVTRLASLGVGFPEVLAVRGDVFYRMSDTGGGPSLMAAFRCAR